MSSITYETFETAWCPGCGNFNLLACLKEALEKLELPPRDVLVAGGIGQAAKIPQYISANGFCGLHGRAVPAAISAKIANENLTVIVSTGDGDSLGEGGNHFIHNIRRNVDVAHFIHNNQIYGLTKGQASPTTGVGQVTDVQVDGNINEPLNPILLAIACGGGFVARAFVGDKEHLTEMMKLAIRHKGYAYLDILQPCVSFNKVNTFGFYKERVYRLADDYDPTDKTAAMQKAMEFGDKIPIGVIYREDKPTFHDKHPVLKEGGPLLDRPTGNDVVKQLMNELV